MHPRIRKFWVWSFLLALTISTSFAQTKIKVACVGNSITEGYGVKDGRTYPIQLQELLGDPYDVRNYGISGRTLLKKGDRPYWKEAKYQEVLQWEPNIVVIKLGTNDSKPQNWKYKADFKKDYVAFVKSFKKLPSHPKVYLSKPMPAYRANFSISPEIIKSEILPLVEAIAKKTHTQVIDLYTPMLGHDDLAPDGIHPTSAGDAILAQEVFKAIK
ncbi:GDSL-type esterase/lipase family protein [Hymenobacter sp. GOD-10R]|uniref:GDSL-type esterase/lipase family protein n=1 Tax=Hymenobacter sp. GOD-10R TaxID=3093922 RepID=UPI002D773F72|nr:GDSL-type esterase/lipase family protein [Hymenobacter sp. GOD-10R]WRQ28381.1 GDSL-type esterase/lipase family protein [Hymenobacter sp. GOD-10R]